MAERAIFLDRDNTIIEDKEGYIGDPAKVKLLPGAATAIASVRRLGYRVIVVSNQSGVARGMFAESDVEAVNQEMCRQLREQAAAHIDASYYCPYHPEAVLAEYRMDHEWRKPKPGMIKQAAEDFDLDLAQCWMIGDSSRDIAAGAAAGCRTILIKDPEHAALDHVSANIAVSPNFIVKSLADAARIVAREGRNPHPDLVPTPLPEKEPAHAGPLPAEGAGALAVEAGSPAAPVPATPAVLTTPVAPTLDVQAVAENVARRVEKNLPKPEPLRPLLEEMLAQLRQSNRMRDTNEFSLSHLLGAVVQVLVVVGVAMGVWDAVKAAQAWNAVSGQNPTAATWYADVLQLLRSGVWLLKGVMWLLTSVILQGVVIALYLAGRR